MPGKRMRVFSGGAFAGLFCRRSGMGSGKGCCFCRRGALSTVSFNEGKSVPGIAHGVVLETPLIGGFEEENFGNFLWTLTGVSDKPQTMSGLSGVP